MTTGEKQLLSYSEARSRQRTHPLRQTEIPVEHAVSLPLPTRRWVGPGYAFFAAPSTRVPERPPVQGAPDRWWVVDAHGGRLILYALCAAVPFAPGTTWGDSDLPPVTRSLDELRGALQQIGVWMDAAAPEFFAGRPGDPALRLTLAEALKAHLPPPLQPQYRALAADFFAWLEA
jgi:hypothetical protein